MTTLVKPLLFNNHIYPYILSLYSKGLLRCYIKNNLSSYFKKHLNFNISANKFISESMFLNEVKLALSYSITIDSYLFNQYNEYWERSEVVLLRQIIRLFPFTYSYSIKSANNLIFNLIYKLSNIQGVFFNILSFLYDKKNNNEEDIYKLMSLTRFSFSKCKKILKHDNFEIAVNNFLYNVYE